MPAAAKPLHPSHDTALDAALAEFALLGLPVARAASRLAEIEQATLDILGPASIQAARAIADGPASLDAARRAGQDLDLTDAARDASTARLATVTACYDKATRAARRTAALRARLAAGRPFRDLTPPTPAAEASIAEASTAEASTAEASTGQEPRPTPHPESTTDADPPERADPPEPSDDLEPDFDPDLDGDLDADPEPEPEPGDDRGHPTPDQVLDGARRDLDRADSDLARLERMRPAPSPIPPQTARAATSLPDLRPGPQPCAPAGPALPPRSAPPCPAPDT